MLIKSIRTAVVLLSLMFMGVITWSVLSLALTEHRQLYADYVESDLNALSDNMASDLVSILGQDDQFFQLKTLLLQLVPYEHVQYAAVYDANWQRVDFYLGASEQALPENQRTRIGDQPPYTLGIHHQAGSVRVVKRIGDPVATLGYLVIVNDFQGPLDNSTHSLLIHTLPTAVAVMLLLMLVFSVLSNRWLAPLTHLSEFARRVQKSKNYNLTVPLTGHYEVSSLADDINNMMEEIRKESEAKQEYVTLLERRKADMEHLANYDSLTGLMNRKYFIHCLQQRMDTAVDQQKSYDLMFIGLDGFKGVNDSLGHEVGDLLLAGVAGRLTAYAPVNAQVCRHGGDEFLMLLEHDAAGTELDTLAAAIVSGLAQKFTISSWEVRITASIGIARQCEQYQDIRELIRDADIAMYDAKHRGKSRFSVFDGVMMVEHQRQVDIANAIVPALQNNEFHLHYQAKVTANGKPAGAEALIRWHSDTLGTVSPAEFIPIAERSGKITDITRWVIQQVCLDIRDVLLPAKIELPVSINLSAIDLQKYHLVGVIKGAFLKYGIPRGMVEFEVTEYSYLDNLEVANKFFDEVSALGCKVALDDFGTGYSSLSYLTKIPIDVIKIDKQFVDNIGASHRDDALVLTIIEMAKRLGMSLCAEGVENKEQVLFLNSYGCQVIQGYYFAKPMRLEDFVSFVQQGQKRRCPA
ncbi:putative bifunctional diguanylate cyclase/phosphodiesterase [Bacterioplanoides sp.]|uniref:putative bifunctional diguanylate cyclase/phosphodiesterase n=1 Tax=Bacterioplanoides sp. TaxID=2066072 RepID=UPI003B007DE8